MKSKQKGVTVLELIMVFAVFAALLGGLVSCVGGEEDPEEVETILVDVNKSIVIDPDTGIDTARVYCGKFDSKIKTISIRQIGLRLPRQTVRLTCTNTVSYNGTYEEFIKAVDIEDSIE